MQNKIAGLYVQLAKTLNALDEAGEDPRGYDGSAVLVQGIDGQVNWTREDGYRVEQA